MISTGRRVTALSQPITTASLQTCSSHESWANAWRVAMWLPIHPGAVQTELARHTIYSRAIVFLVLWYVTKNPQERAQSTIFCAVAEEMEGVSGKYLADPLKRFYSPQEISSHNSLTKVQSCSASWTCNDYMSLGQNYFKGTVVWV